MNRKNIKIPLELIVSAIEMADDEWNALYGACRKGRCKIHWKMQSGAGVRSADLRMPLSAMELSRTGMTIRKKLIGRLRWNGVIDTALHVRMIKLPLQVQ